jgi:hypothetical protein
MPICQAEQWELSLWQGTERTGPTRFRKGDLEGAALCQSVVHDLTTHGHPLSHRRPVPCSSHQSADRPSVSHAPTHYSAC